MTREEDKGSHNELKQSKGREEWQAAIDEMKNRFELGTKLKVCNKSKKEGSISRRKERPGSATAANGRSGHQTSANAWNKLDVLLFELSVGGYTHSNPGSNSQPVP